jgi:WD domain, G-beta repeat
LVAALLVAAAAIWQYFDATAAKREALVDLDRAVRAEDAANKAKEQANASLRQAQTTQSLFLADEARVWRERGDAGDGVLLALESLPDAAAGVDRPYVSEAKLQLDGARHALKERVILGHQGTVYSAAFSPDGLRIVTASADKTARIWDAASGQPIGEPLKGHQGTVYSAAFSPDGLRIVTASGDGTARMWDVATGKPDRRAARRPSGCGV